MITAAKIHKKSQICVVHIPDAHPCVPEPTPCGSDCLAATSFGLCVGLTEGAAGRPEASGGDGGGKNTFRSLKLREKLYDRLENWAYNTHYFIHNFENHINFYFAAVNFKT
jgi:hypothetical protein